MIDNDAHLVGPILLLPEDVTTEIFERVVWVDIDTLNEYDSKHPPRLTTPLTLGAVCSSWRSLVWATPSLWTIIVLRLKKKPRYKAQIDTLNVWFENSRPHPLDIWFDAGFYSDHMKWSSDEFGLDIIQDAHIDIGPPTVALQKLVRQSSRWRRFTSGVINDTMFIDVLRQVKGKLPLLQKCRINVSLTVGHVPMKLEMFSKAPQLIEFDITQLYIHYVSLPWNQLLSLRGRYSNEVLCGPLLSQCTSLEVLRLEGIYDLSIVIPVLEQLPWLRSLTLCSVDDTDSFVGTILTKLDLSATSTVFLPNLTELRYVVDSTWALSYSLPRSSSFAFLRILRQRWNPPNGVARLRTLDMRDMLTFDESQDRAVVKGLRDLMRDGMNISVIGL